MKNYGVVCRISLKYPPVAGSTDSRHPHRHKAIISHVNYNASFLATGDGAARKAAYRWLGDQVSKWVDGPGYAQGYVEIMRVEIRLSDVSRCIDESGKVVAMPGAAGRIVLQKKLKDKDIERFGTGMKKSKSAIG